MRIVSWHESTMQACFNIHTTANSVNSLLYLIGPECFKTEISPCIKLTHAPNVSQSLD